MDRKTTSENVQVPSYKDSSGSRRVTFAPPFKSISPSDSPKSSPRGVKLKDNLSPIYDKIAVYKCNNIPPELNIRTAIEFSLLCDALYRRNHLDGYLVEDFICESVGILKLHITLPENSSPDKLIERYHYLKENRYIFEDIDEMCLGQCKFLRNINSSFCNRCEREYGWISKDKMKELQYKILSSMNSSRREEYRNTRSFLTTPLPDFVCETKYQDVTLSFKFVGVYGAR